MDNPTSEPFFGSKTMILLCIGMGLVVLVFILAVVVKVVWGVDVFNLAGLSVGGISTHSGAGTVRNTMVDGQTRALNASQATSLTPGQLQAVQPPPAPQSTPTVLSGLGDPPRPP